MMVTVKPAGEYKGIRKHYLDNIRWATVVLVLIYHVFYFTIPSVCLSNAKDAEYAL